MSPEKLRVPKIPDRLARAVAKVRESMPRSLREVGRPAMERFEGQHELPDVIVNHLRSAA